MAKLFWALLLILIGFSIAGEVSVKVPCNGKVGDCLWQDGQEMEMDSETNRRVLWGTATHKRYISYEALKGDVVPCNKPGVSYYDCHSLPRTANGPYNRGCQMISACRGG